MGAEAVAQGLTAGGEDMASLMEVVRDINPPELCRIMMSMVLAQNRNNLQIRKELRDAVDSLNSAIEALNERSRSEQAKRQDWWSVIARGVVQSVITVLIMGGFYWMALNALRGA